MGLRVLITTTVRWRNAARIAQALTDMSCEIFAMCPGDDPLVLSGLAKRRFFYSPYAPQRSLAKVIVSARPDLILPCDDRAAAHLRDLYSIAKTGTRAEDGTIAASIRRSLGGAAAQAQLQSRTHMMEIAQQAGVQVAASEIVAAPEDIAPALSRIGLPAMVKADGSWGGEGVSLVHSQAEALAAYSRLSKPLGAYRTLRRMVWRNEPHLLPTLFNPVRPTINLQKFVPGSSANSAIACWKGKVLAAIHVDVLQETKQYGTASVVRIVDDPQMAENARRISARLELSGFHGLDYMRRKDTGEVHLIEMNPRATQMMHMTLGPGRDLCQALVAAAGGTAQERKPDTISDIIALFPQEWTRDPDSPYLRTAYHDIPARNPRLLLACSPPSFRRRAR